MKKKKEWHNNITPQGNSTVPVRRSSECPINNPFGNLENIMKVNVVSTTDRYMRCIEIASAPFDHYKVKGLLVGDALEFCHKNNSGRYKVETLARDSKSLIELQLAGVYFNGHEYEFDGWIDALVSISKLLAQKQMDSFDDLEVSGLLEWIEPAEENLSRGEALAQGKANIHLTAKYQVCASLQILFLICGVPLNHVAIRYNAYTDEQWERRQKKIQAKVNAAVARRMHEEKQKRKAREEFERRKEFAEQEEIRKRISAEEENKQQKVISKLKSMADTDPEAVRKLGNLGLKRCPRCRQWFRIKEYEYMRHVATCGELQAKRKIYVVIDGVVEFIGSGIDSDNHILRSENDAEDTFTGLGHFARDNGRYGSIDGVDYAD